jgi:hypothetical protein
VINPPKTAASARGKTAFPAKAGKNLPHRENFHKRYFRDRQKEFAFFGGGDIVGTVVEPVESLFSYELDDFCIDDGRFVGALWHFPA